MADDIPVEDVQVQPQGGQGQGGMYNRIDRGLTNFFGPINRAMEPHVGKGPRSIPEGIMQLLSAVRPGMGMAPRMPMPQPRIPNQPQSPPGSSDLILQMLQQRANPQGVLQSTRAEQASQAPFRGQTFEPIAEQLMRPVDAMHGTRVLTPANMSPDQAYNWALMNRIGRR